MTDQYDEVTEASIQGPLTHLGQVTHACISKFTNIGSDNGVSLGRHQAII